MRAFVPEISWHNRLPALSLDIAKGTDEAKNHYRVATGGNDCRVYIWLVDLGSPKTQSNPVISIRAGLRRHQKSVGAVRFSPMPHMLATGDDDGYIYLWKHKIDQEHELQQRQESIESNAFLNDDGFEDLELWQQQRVLRGHIEDICDLAWSKDGQFLLSGSVDNSAILWDTAKGTKIWCSDLIKGYVQGVAIDPHAQFMAAISSDRTLRIYNFIDKRLLNATRRMNVKGKFKAFFSDDTVKTFCRRLEFSPDGQFLLAPTSRLIERDQKQPATSVDQKIAQHQTEQQSDLDVSAESSVSKEEETPVKTNGSKAIEVIQLEDSSEVATGTATQDDAEVKVPQPVVEKPEKLQKPIHVLLVFKRSSFSKPTYYYPTVEVALCARFSPVIYQLKNSETNFWGLPYRIVFAVATARSVLIYDSQQTTPIGYIAQIHLARLTDLAWSDDGRMLMITSYDGYSTIVIFEKGEFGENYTEPLLDPVIKSSTNEEEKVADESLGGDNQEEKPTKKGQKRMKPPKEPVAAKKEKLNLEEDPEGEDKSKDVKAPKKATPKKITPTRLPESATMWRFITKKS